MALGILKVRQSGRWLADQVANLPVPRSNLLYETVV